MSRQLSAISYQLSAISYQLSAAGGGLPECRERQSVTGRIPADDV
jgi:hypothetical protein